MTRKRARVIWMGLCAAADVSDRFVVPAILIDELTEAGFFKDGALDADALDRFAWTDDPKTEPA
jgi:hypothetical protein